MSKSLIYCQVSQFVEAYICLGSNCDDSQTMLRQALKEIASLPASRLVACSSIYFTEPQDYTKQPWFSNQVIKILLDRPGNSRWQARNLLAALLDIESRLGRVRDPAIRFGPRKIDIDLLLFGQTVIADPFCTLPHPRMTQRAFVLVPLVELNPDLRLGNRTTSQLLAALDYRQEGKKIFQKPD